MCMVENTIYAKKMLLFSFKFLLIAVVRQCVCKQNFEDAGGYSGSLIGKAWKVTSKHGQGYSTNICSTPQCQITGDSMLSSVNFSIDPCQDFYQFACGNWIAKRPLFPAENYRSVSGDLQTLVQYQLRDVLSAKTASRLGSAQKKAKQFYAQCMDEGLAERQGTASLTTLLCRILGGWPLITANWSAASFDFLTATTELSHCGVGDLLLDMAVAHDPINSTKNAIFLSPATGFGKDFLHIANGQRYIRMYPNLIKNVALFLRFGNAPPKFSMENLDYLLRLEEDIHELHALHLFLTNVTAAAAEYYATQPLSVVPMNVSEFRSTYFFRSNFASNLISYMQMLFHRSLTNSGLNSSKNFVVANSTNVYVAAPLIMEAIDGKLAQLENSNKGRRLLANYLGWQMIASYSATLPKTVGQYFQDQRQIVAGVTEGLPKWMDCIKTVRTVLPAAVGALYVQKYAKLHPTAKSQVKQMIYNLRQEFRSMLSKTQWMDKATRFQALTKLKDMLEYDLYEEHLSGNSNVVDKLYFQFDMKESLFDTTVSWARVNTDRNLAKIATENKRDDGFLTMDASATNGFYNPSGNYLAILAGIAQAPYVNWFVPSFYTYGGLGWVIGHEITHGFDNAGSQRDEQGNIFNWWSNKSRMAFANKAAELVKQFNRFKIGERSVDGMLTLTENIADLGGIKAAYGAYIRKTKQLDQHEETLPGFEFYSPRQMFFLSAAQIWCGHYDPDFQQLMLLTDVHSPLQLRVNAIFANLKSFADAYQCTVGTPMNSENTVNLW
ncbi:membrane metallo-endopeptidase-like 1 [Paramacrobiotus metropolitanus]|uniref:membrane metallo-endopeptidase-like 1 n=1 Tax=Paramacrobiotus metropolitanus TaxID=2943436 RepID=UPI002445B60D|nr:membrane metallo-endopeptidase-like 1 [Paramacrobiotus metropolitanus]